MDRYFGIGFHFDPVTGALTASMLHAVLKILATCCTDSLPTQRTPYTMDLFDDSTDKTPVDQKQYIKIVGCLIHLLMVRS